MSADLHMQQWQKRVLHFAAHPDPRLFQKLLISCGDTILKGLRAGPCSEAASKAILANILKELEELGKFILVQILTVGCK
jgi:hypothetical protein